MPVLVYKHGKGRKRTPRDTTIRGEYKGQRWEVHVFDGGFLFFTINGSVKADSHSLPASTRRGLVIAAVKAWREYLETVPQGTVFKCVPSDDTAVSRERRAEFYRALGFRESSATDGRK